MHLFLNCHHWLPHHYRPNIISIFFLQVKLFVIDLMHTLDNGVLRQGLFQVLRTGYDNAKERMKYVSAPLPPSQNKLFSEALQNVFENMRACLPEEYVRKPRPPSFASQYKSRECNTVGVLFVPALWHIPEVQVYLDKGIFKNFMNLVTGIKLVGGFSPKPLPQVYLVCLLLIRKNIKC
jgi:hypothetical protein